MTSPRPALIGGFLSLAVLLVTILLLFFDQGTSDLPRGEPLTRGPGDAPSADGAGALPAAGSASTPAESTGGETAAPEDPGPAQLSGRVTGEGQGVPGATVHLFATRELVAVLLRLEKLMPRDGQIPDIPLVITNLRREIQTFKEKEIVAATAHDGVYEFRGLSPGGYFVLTLSDEWLFKFDDVVSIPPEGEQRLDIELQRGARLDGQVVHTLGHALGGVTVTAEYRPGGLPGVGRVIRRALQYVNGELLRGPFQRTSAEDGTFSFAGLPPGIYDITAEHPNGVRGTVAGVDTGATSVIVYLGQGAVVRGHLIDADGVPVEGVDVVLEAEEERIQLPLPLAAFTDVATSVYAALGEGPRRAASGSDGAFHVYGLSPGRYLFSVETAGFLPLRRTVEVDWGSTEDLGPVQLSRGEAVSGVVQSLAGDPIEGATVLAAPAEVGFLNMGQVMKDFLGQRVSARTGASGDFHLAGLVRGAYNVTAAADGFASVRLEATTPASEPLVFSLEPGRTIEGRVVTAADGAPIAGARVRCRGARADTDAEGRFVLTGVVPAGRAASPFDGGPIQRARRRAEARVTGGTGEPIVRVRASLEGYLPSRIEVNLDERTDDLEFALRAAPRIWGRVVDPDGHPAPGTILRLTPPIPIEAEGMMARFGIHRGSIFFGLAVADLEGRFSFGSYVLPRESGTVQVLASHPMYASSHSEPVSLDDSSSDVEVEVQLARGCTVEGVVTDGSAPVKGATVRLVRARADADAKEADRFATFARLIGLPKGGDTVYTNGEGRFAFTQLLPGTFTISAEMPQFTDSPEQAVSVDAGDTREVELVVDPGGGIAGRVRDTNGDPVPAARVRLVRRPAESGERDLRRYTFEKMFGGAYKQTRSDAEGAFQLAGLPDGRYTLVVSRDGYAPTEILDLEPDGRELEIELVAAASLAGRVADAATGEPLVDFRVRLEREGERGKDVDDEFRVPRTRGYQDSQGLFRRADLVPGVYDCRVSASGFLPIERKVELRAGEPREEEFLLAQAGRIRGVVIDSATQRPIFDAVVRVVELPARSSEEAADSAAETRRGEETPEEAREEDRRALRGYWGERTRGEGKKTKEDGTFVLEGVPLDARAVVAESEGYIPQVIEGFAMGVGRELEIDFALKPGRSIGGTVVDAAGNPAPGRFVFLRGVSDGSRHVRKSDSADPRGQFQIGGLPRGTYRVFSPGREGRPGAPAVVVVVEGDARDVQLRLEE